MAFAGSVVFLSRNLVPPEAFSSLIDVLSQNGAEVCLCCDPSRNAPNEFHVLFSPDSDKFDVLRANGCQIVGPHCVLRCARERKPLPRVYSCCLAMEGIKIVPTGFHSQEKLKIEQLVASMGGTLEHNVSCADFVLAKTVMGSKYKLACRLEKPVVNFRWLLQCCREHRLAPHEPHRLPVFMGLVICATQIVPDARRKIYDAAVQHGGVFSPDLTKECTHLIANTPDGDKYKVAKNWGTVKIVNQEWFWRSISMKTCMDESGFLIPAIESTPRPVNPKPAVSPAVTEAPLPVAATIDPEPEPEPDTEPHCETVSELSNDNLYLANCRVYLIGFNTTEMRRLVKMVLDGGGARYMELNRTVTHVVLGQPSESDLKKVELAAMWGATHVVTPLWLEECTQQQKEISVNKKHVASLSKRRVAEGPFRTMVIPDRTERSTVSSNKEDSRLSDARDNVQDPPASKPALQKDPSKVFQGGEFKFLDPFPLSKRDEICQWISEGGGSVNQESMKPDYLIGVHGSRVGDSNVVSSHWVKDCLQEKKLLDVAGHVLYRPLTCRVPLPGFQSFKFCISSYPERDRLLCRNLCYVLGAKFTENLTGTVTHLICRFADGEKYKAATLRGIRVVTMEWLYACATQNAVVAVDDYDPKPNTGDTVTTQYPSQAARLAAGEWVGSPYSVKRKQRRTDLGVSQKRPALSTGHNNSRIDVWDEPSAASWPLSNEGNKTSQPSSDRTEYDKETAAQASPGKENTAQASASCGKEKPEEAASADQASRSKAGVVAEQAADVDLNADLNADDEESAQPENRTADPKQDSQPDVAAAIENLLAQTGMARNGDAQNRDSSGEEEQILSDASLRSRTSMLSRISSRPQQAAGGEPVERLRNVTTMEVDDKFEESQVCSQIVAYDEDHSERQLIMERLRNGSSLRSVKKSTLSRNSGLGRLFEAAEANK